VNSCAKANKTVPNTDIPGTSLSATNDSAFRWTIENFDVIFSTHYGHQRLFHRFCWCIMRQHVRYLVFESFSHKNLKAFWQIISILTFSGDFEYLVTSGSLCKGDVNMTRIKGFVSYSNTLNLGSILLAFDLNYLGLSAFGYFIPCVLIEWISRL